MSNQKSTLVDFGENPIFGEPLLDLFWFLELINVANISAIILNNNGSLFECLFLFPTLSLTLITTLRLEMKDCTQVIHLAEKYYHMFSQNLFLFLSILDFILFIV